MTACLDSNEEIAARRRAFGVLEDGERTLAAVELLAANGDGRPRNSRALSAADEERLFDAQLAIEEAAAVNGAPSVLRDVQAMLAEEDAAEQEALIQDIAAKIPGGTESVADFRREQRVKAENAARRREIAALPDGRALLDAEDDFDPRMGVRGPLVEDEIDPSGGDFRINFREGRGARTFDLTRDKEALFATPSSEGFIPERLIEIYKRGRFSEAEVSFVEGFSDDARERARLIALFEESEKLTDQRKAEALRDGGPSNGSGFPAAVGPIVDFGGAILEGGREMKDGAVGLVEDLSDQLGDQMDTLARIPEILDRFGPTERTPHQIDDLRRGLNEIVGASGGSVPSLRCLTADGVDRLHDGFLAVVTTDTRGLPKPVAEAKKFRAFVDGITGRISPDGADHPNLRFFPEGSLPREIGGWAVEQASDPLFVAGGPLGKLLKAGAKTWVAQGLGSKAVNELLTGADCDES